MFVTGDALGPSIRGFLDETGLPYLEKPIVAEEVLALVGRIAGKSAGEAPEEQGCPTPPEAR